MRSVKHGILHGLRALASRLFSRPSMRDTVVLRRAWGSDDTIVRSSTMVLIEVYVDGQSRLIALPARPSLLNVP